MQIKTSDKQGNIYSRDEIKSLFVCEDNGTPLAIIKEAIIGDLRNYKILTPGDKEFDQITRSMGFAVEVVSM